MGDHCQCKETGMILTPDGQCKRDNYQEKEGCMNDPMSVWKYESMECWTAVRCPEEEMFSRCTSGCRHVRDFQEHSGVAEIYCNGCMPGSHHVRFRNREVCAPDHAFWDCHEQQNATMGNSTAMTGGMAMP